MVLELLTMTEQDIPGFKRNIQEAFQKGFEDDFVGDGNEGMFKFEKVMRI